MATAIKHKLRSQRSHNKKVDYSDFYRNAQLKKAMKEEKNSIFSKLFHRTTNK